MLLHGTWNKTKYINKRKKIVEYIIRFWGSGSMKVKNKLYEQVNLQLNIKKAQKILNGTQRIILKKV